MCPRILMMKPQQKSFVLNNIIPKNLHIKTRKNATNGIKIYAIWIEIEIYYIDLTTNDDLLNIGKREKIIDD